MSHQHTHARTYARTHACTHARTHTHAHAHTHTHTHTHTPEKQCLKQLLTPWSTNVSWDLCVNFTGYALVCCTDHCRKAPTSANAGLCQEGNFGVTDFIERALIQQSKHESSTPPTLTRVKGGGGYWILLVFSLTVGFIVLVVTLYWASSSPFTSYRPLG